MEPYARNIPLLYVYSIFIKRVSMPIIILYFLLNNLNYTQIGILAAVMAVTTLSTEIHGGIFADVHGKKKSLILSSLFGMLTMFLYLIGNSFPYFLLASLTYGLGGAFITGTRNSLLYDTLRRTERTHEFKKYSGKMVLYSHLVNALVLVMIPLIYVISPKLPFLIGIGFFLVSMVTALFFTEPFETAGRKKSYYNRRLLEALRDISSSRRLLTALLFSMVTAGFVYMTSQFIQPLLLISGLNVVYFGIVYALMRAVMGFGASITHRLEKYLSFEGLLLFGSMVIVLGFLGFYIGFGLIIILSVLLIKFSEGFNRIVLQDETNKNIKSDNRTTMLSISSLLDESFNAVLVLFFGFGADLIGVQSIFIYAIPVFLISIALVFVFRKN